LQDAIRTALNIGPDVMSEPIIDYLDRPYLLFCADFDVAQDATAPLRDYLTDLWARMRPEWSAVLAHCEGWNADKADFVDYILANRIETTMPFNDYPVSSTSSVPPILIPVMIAAFVGIGAGFGVYFSVSQPLGYLGWALTIPGGLLAFVCAWLAAVFVAGPRSLPWAPGTDLKTVLKALHLQAHFTCFVIDQQGSSPEELQRAFQAFITKMQPDNNDTVTQLPGVVPAEVQ
jgi:hypothetical protein